MGHDTFHEARGRNSHTGYLLGGDYQTGLRDEIRMQIFNVLKKPVQKESERPSDLRPVTAREVKAETPGFSSRAQGTQVPPCDLLGCPKGGLCI